MILFRGCVTWESINFQKLYGNSLREILLIVGDGGRLSDWLKGTPTPQPTPSTLVPETEPETGVRWFDGPSILGPGYWSWLGTMSWAAWEWIDSNIVTHHGTAISLVFLTLFVTVLCGAFSLSESVWRWQDAALSRVLAQGIGEPWNYRKMWC